MHAAAGRVEHGRQRGAGRPARPCRSTLDALIAATSGTAASDAGGASSARMRRVHSRAGMPVTPPPPWVADEHWYRPSIGVVKSA